MDWALRKLCKYPRTLRHERVGATSAEATRAGAAAFAQWRNPTGVVSSAPAERWA